MRRPSRRTITVPTPERLKNAALFYLSRYAASEASLRRVLQNRVRRAQQTHPDFAADPERLADLQNAIERIVEAHKKTGALNDAALADMKVASLRRAGRSTRYIQQKLAVHGLKQALVARALTRYDGENDGEGAEKKAALAFARKRRLGPYRNREKDKDGIRQKDFAVLARAGFGMNIIRAILNVSSDEEMESWE